jgi:hypothetical protein
METEKLGAGTAIWNWIGGSRVREVVDQKRRGEAAAAALGITTSQRTERRERWPIGSFVTGAVQGQRPVDGCGLRHGTLIASNRTRERQRAKAGDPWAPGQVGFVHVPAIWPGNDGYLDEAADATAVDARHRDD